jgi:hypothetical protein
MRRGDDNVLETELLRALVGRVEEATLDARAIVLTGRGDIFARGIDVKPRGIDGLDALLNAPAHAFSALFSCPLPVVAEVNGDAIAGGCVMASASHVRVMTCGRSTCALRGRVDAVLAGRARAAGAGTGRRLTPARARRRLAMRATSSVRRSTSLCGSWFSPPIH